jgi:hypothetical protein
MRHNNNKNKDKNDINKADIKNYHTHNKSNSYKKIDNNNSISNYKNSKNINENNSIKFIISQSPLLIS